MSNLLDEILADLAAEGDALEAVVADLDEAAWRTQTPAEGWDIATTIVHLAWTDEVAIASATDKERWDELILRAIDNPDGFVDAEAFAGAKATGAEILARWQASRPVLARVLREFPAGEKLMWFGPPMAPASMATARLMETWAHGLDVCEALGVPIEPTDRMKHVASLGYRTRNYSFTNNGLAAPTEEVRVELVAPSGAVWTFGPEDAPQRVTGTAWDFCRLVTQRINRSDTDLVAVGAEADQWLDIAQCFAGPSGDGRPPAGEDQS